MNQMRDLIHMLFEHCPLNSTIFSPELSLASSVALLLTLLLYLFIVDMFCAIEVLYIEFLLLKIP
ncbi:hypothetical protein [Clostridium sp.]|mgnify:FL=1|jgi:hypothetical protein|uniref:hypothetical protein n=1 Tax=Clostridium sp. TaxID=1506 RepID=UPI003FD77409